MVYTKDIIDNRKDNGIESIYDYNDNGKKIYTLLKEFWSDVLVWNQLDYYANPIPLGHFVMLLLLLFMDFISVKYIG